MKRALGAMVIAALTATALISAPAGASTKLDNDLLASKAKNPRAIVVFKHDVTPSTITRLADAGVLQVVRIDTIDAVGAIAPLSAYKKIATWSDVVVVDADSPIHFNLYASKKRIGADLVQAGNTGQGIPFNGAGVTVAVVDTGIDTTHPDLKDKVIEHLNFEGGWFFDMINDGLYSDQVAKASGNAVDSYGHGTHVAGIVAGSGAAAQGGIDMKGVAPGAKLVNFKIADVIEGVDCSVPCDFGWEINALVAFEYMIEHRNDPQYPGGIRVSTNSWSIYEVDDPEVEPINLITEAAVKKGIITLFAAGNDGPGANTVGWPGSVPSVITVAASCKTAGCSNIANFSSRGTQVDIAAPGMDIYSAMAVPSALAPLGTHAPPPTTATDPAAALNNARYYTGFNGTSMATPHVAGVVALMLQADPGLTPAEAQEILTRTATDRGTEGFDNLWGWGLVDSVKATDVAYCLGAENWMAVGGTSEDCFTDPVGVVSGAFYN
jgi:serine protease AprX